MRSLLKKRDGFTLVEVIVAFGLTTVLIAAIVTVLVVSTRIFVRLEGNGRAQSVSQAVMRRIVNELAAAERLEVESAQAASQAGEMENGDMRATSSQTEIRESGMKDGDVRAVSAQTAGRAGETEADRQISGCDTLWYTDADGRAVQLYIDADGQLVLAYPEDSGAPAEVWSYPESFYGGCAITDLHVEQSAESADVLQVSLKVSHIPTGAVWQSDRSVRCWNLTF